MGCGQTYIDIVTRGESFSNFITLYSDYDPETDTGTPLDLTGYSADGYVTPSFNNPSEDQTPLTVLIDTPPTTGNIFYSLTESQVNALPVGVNKLRLYWTTPDGDRDVILESPSFTVIA